MGSTELVQELRGGLDRAKKAALLDEDEIVISLEGSSGEALVATKDRVIILKAGMSSGAMGGHKASCYWYDDIVSVEFSSGKTLGRIEVAVAGAKKTESTGGVYKAMLAENVVQFGAAEYDRWVAVHKVLLQLVKSRKPVQEPA